MAAEILIGAAIGAGTLYVWGWRRFKYVRSHWQYRQRTDELERSFREARDELSAASPYRPASTGDAELVALLRAVAADEHALTACGFTLLGDIVVQPAARAATAIMRTFSDPANTTCAVLGVTCKQPTLVRFGLTSWTDDEMYTTWRGPQPNLAEPTFVHRQTAAADLTPAKVILLHTEFARLDDPEKAFIRVTSGEAHLAALATMRQRIVGWRDAQPPDALLDADLRSVLGEHYATAGKAWARRLRGNLPQATARRL